MTSDDQRYQHERELREQWQETHLAIHEADAQLRTLAIAEIYRRLEELNGHEAQASADRATYISREWFEKLYETQRRETEERFESSITGRDLLRTDMNNKNTLQDLAINAIERKLSNFEGRIWMLGAVISAIVIVINVLFKAWR